MNFKTIFYVSLVSNVTLILAVTCYIVFTMNNGDENIPTETQVSREDRRLAVDGGTAEPITEGTIEHRKEVGPSPPPAEDPSVLINKGSGDDLGGGGYADEVEEPEETETPTVVETPTDKEDHVAELPLEEDDDTVELPLEEDDDSADVIKELIADTDDEEVEEDEEETEIPAVIEIPTDKEDNEDDEYDIYDGEDEGTVPEGNDSAKAQLEESDEEDLELDFEEEEEDFGIDQEVENDPTPVGDSGSTTELVKGNEEDSAQEDANVKPGFRISDSTNADVARELMDENDTLELSCNYIHLYTGVGSGPLSINLGKGTGAKYMSGDVEITVSSDIVDTSEYRYYSHILGTGVTVESVRVGNIRTDKRPMEPVTSVTLYKWERVPLMMLLTLENARKPYYYYYYDYERSIWANMSADVKFSGLNLVSTLNNLNSKAGNVLTFDIENVKVLDHGYTDLKPVEYEKYTKFVYIPTAGLHIKTPRLFNIYSLTSNCKLINGITTPIYDLKELSIYHYNYPSVTNKDSNKSVPLVIRITTVVGDSIRYSYYAYKFGTTWATYIQGTDPLNKDQLEVVIGKIHKKYGINSLLDFDVCKKSSYTLAGYQITVTGANYTGKELQLRHVYDLFIHDIPNTNEFKLGKLLCNGKNLLIPDLYTGLVETVSVYLDDDTPMIIQINTNRSVINYFSYNTGWKRVDKRWGND